jgi:iron complex transport system substrate-binding protein
VTSSSRYASAALALLLGLTLVGCQPGSYDNPSPAPQPAGERESLRDIDWLDDPKAWVGPSTALMSSDIIEPVALNPQQTLPATVTSNELTGDITLTIESTERVLALDMSGSLAATVWALGFGDQLVGRDISSTFPGVLDLPVVTGSGHAISPESVLAMRPDLIITDGTIGPIDVVLQLREAGITVVFVRVAPGLSQAAGLARSVASIFGAPEVGEVLAAQVDQEIASVTAVIRDRAPRATADKLRMVFLYIRGGNGIYYLFGEESGAGELIEALGGIDIATETGWVGLRPMTDEALIAANPDLILVMTGGVDSVGGVEKLVALKPALGLTPAGQNLRFVDMADSQVLSFGPRTPQVIDALARAIYSPGD